MADKDLKISENVAGPYYVDTNCISCELCVQTAEENFAMNDDGMAYVKKQPADDEEIELCEEALESCPAEAIGSDG